jgi:nucleoid-associated protein YgaU
MPGLYDSSSRYRLDENGQTASRVDPRTSTWVTYTVREGDNLENIAYRHLGRHTRYWEIADINPQVKFPADLSVGMVIRLPS